MLKEKGEQRPVAIICHESVLSPVDPLDRPLCLKLMEYCSANIATRDEEIKFFICQIGYTAMVSPLNIVAMMLPTTLFTNDHFRDITALCGAQFVSMIVGYDTVTSLARVDVRIMPLQHLNEYNKK
jgi:hypothetical protein